jgi:hypothetical protein
MILKDKFKTIITGMKNDVINESQLKEEDFLNIPIT